MYDREAGKVPNMTVQEYIQQTSAMLHASLGSLYEIETEIEDDVLTVYMYDGNKMFSCQLFFVQEVDQYIFTEVYVINDVNNDAVWDDFDAITESFETY